MSFSIRVGVVCLTALAAVVSAAPVITDVQNAASNIPTGLPNAGIAQGAMFVVKGSGLGPASVVVATSFPLTTALGNTGVKVTVGGQTRDAIMYYTLDRQVAAILPSSTPTGTGTVTVTYNGETSAAAPITVVDRNVAIYTLDSSGSGPAVATFADSFVGPGNAAKSGDIVILWANGLGAVSGDETRAANQADMNVPGLEVWVGGRQAEVLFRGRNNCCSSVDTIYVRMPAGLSGCATPVTIRIGNLVSNTATVPVAASGSVCTPTNPNVSQDDIQRLITKGNFSFGGIGLSRTTVSTQGISIPGLPPQPGTTVRSEGGSATFARVTTNSAAAVNSQVDTVSYGACTVFSFTGQTANPVGNIGIEYLDAGASVSVTGPGGARSMARRAVGGTIGYFEEFPAGYLAAGNYTIAAPGGPGVNSFSTSIAMPPALEWTNRAALTTVTRGSGATVNWTGGDPTGYISISGGSFVSLAQNRFVSVTFNCNARVSDRTFTIPPVVLLALPPSGGQTIGGVTIELPGNMSVAAVVSKPFSVSNLDFATVSATDVVGQSTTFR